MKRGSDNELKHLHDVLIPILAQAAIGDFSAMPEISSAYAEETNDLLAGVGVLMEVIREKIAELEKANAALEAAHRRSLNILDDVLTRSLERN